MSVQRQLRLPIALYESRRDPAAELYKIARAKLEIEAGVRRLVEPYLQRHWISRKDFEDALNWLDSFTLDLFYDAEQDLKKELGLVED